jgi:hypothetical protein
MNIKNLLLATVGAAVLAVPAQSQAQIDRRTIESIGAMILAERLGLDPGMILGSQQRTGASVYELAPAFALHRQARSHQPHDIWAMRNRGMGWGQIAQELGIHPGTFNKMRVAGDFDTNHIWRDGVRNGLYLEEASVSRLRNMGMSWQDISVATVLARESGRNVNDVANMYRNTKSWNTTASRLGVRQATLDQRINDWRRTNDIPRQWRSGNATAANATSGNLGNRGNSGKAGGNQGKGKGNQGKGGQGKGKQGKGGRG